MRKDIKASCGKRLSRIEGQVRGIARMVDEDRYCIDIVTQISAVRAALRAGGVLAVWSAWEDRRFEQRLRHGGFTVHVERVRARLKKGGPRHTIFLGHL